MAVKGAEQFDIVKDFAPDFLMPTAGSVRVCPTNQKLTVSNSQACATRSAGSA
jgi:hypothetical protein